ncbi:MAG: hypothetical protein QT03_C0001G1281 [archaeon GW2011_AR10]|uniref:DNA primase small subunit PriS n=1 Tax=Candidatus Iainarchaeum sp. TaxID=3101447 RepID=A0A7J4IRN9_9ARCH|nr:MAG: hypothetical protein QT03_C0001G1281 [archaeon GW2011_AR10]HIH08102.1 hypothetical protein [Candidatus Diapherotrites archaeon]
MNEAVFLREKFREYYEQNKVSGPSGISQREFGVGEFGKKITSRHLSFSSADEFNSFLRNNAPLFISHSLGYYAFPSARPMNAKELLKADLIYEFDADDLKTECKKSHDSWFCGNCGSTGKGNVSNCSKCGAGVEVDEWVCPDCLKAVKAQVFKLMEFLEEDFGVSEGISLNYSGSKGFHIHISDENFSKLSPQARVDLVDYLTAYQIDPVSLGFFLSKQKKFVCPPPGVAAGWQKRILNGVEALFERGSFEEIAVAGNVTTASAKQLLNERSTILSKLAEGVLFQLPGKKTEGFWNSVIEYVVKLQRLDIDRQTSVDISKIIRVPDTLHGSTGLVAKTIPFQEFKEFEALNSAVVFGGEEIVVQVAKTPKFFLHGEWWGPFDGEKAGLPEFVAVYLIAKSKAHIVSGV